MKLELYMLGTGGAFAKKYANNNGLFTCGDYTLLVDCGITAPRVLHEIGMELDRIDGILITHLHGDHVGGLEELAFRMKYIYGKKLRLLLPEALIEPIWENTLRGGMENRREGMNCLNDYFEVTPLAAHVSVELAPGFTIESLPTRHIPDKASVALILNEKMFFSSDTVFDRSLIDYVYYERGCKHLLHECQLTGPGVVHTALDDLLALPEEIQRATLLMHYGDEMERFTKQTGSMHFLLQQKLYTFDL
ncbi:MAG: ribonuclease Z [Gorillibacterium sp.]|nr:ribonuclease Z [Gorillibacterium sp.]